MAIMSFPGAIYAFLIDKTTSTLNGTHLPAAAGTYLSAIGGTPRMPMCLIGSQGRLLMDDDGVQFPKTLFCLYNEIVQKKVYSYL